MRNIRSNRFLTTIIAAFILTGCATMQHISELSKLKFTLDRVSSVRVAGIDIMNITDARELNVYQISRITLAASRETLPLDLTLHLKSENPMINQVAATITRMDWTLVLDGRDTISGTLEEDITLPAGVAQEIPLRLSLNLFEFFNDKNAMDLLDLALAFAGEGGAIPKGIALKVRPTINTIIGPLTYSSPILIKPNMEANRQAH